MMASASRCQKKNDESYSREQRRKIRIIKQLLDKLKSAGISEDDIKQVNFCSLLKGATKKENCQKDFNDHSLFNKVDFDELFKHIVSTKEGKRFEENCRVFSRSSINEKNIFLFYFAHEYPDLMRAIANNCFSSFTFCSKLSNKLVIENNWCQYVQKIQDIKSQKIQDIKSQKIQDIESQNSVCNPNENIFESGNILETIDSFTFLDRFSDDEKNQENLDYPFLFPETDENNQENTNEEIGGTSGLPFNFEYFSHL